MKRQSLEGLDVVIDDESEFPCPYCGLSCFVAIEPEPGLMHNLPVCKKFVDNDPMQIARDARTFVDLLAIAPRGKA